MSRNEDVWLYRPCVGITLFNAEGLVFIGRRRSKRAVDPAAQGYEWQMPQGGIDSGEMPRAAALRELREETGLRAERYEHLGRLFAGYGFCSQGYDVYLATGLTAGEPEREPSESDMVHEWRSSADLRDMIRRGEFADAHSIAALALHDNTR